MNIFAPNYYVQSFKTLNIQKLHEMGIQLLLCDIDNTLVAYDEECPNQDVIDFINKLPVNSDTFRSLLLMECILPTSLKCQYIEGHNDL